MLFTLAAGVVVQVPQAGQRLKMQAARAVQVRRIPTQMHQSLTQAAAVALRRMVVQAQAAQAAAGQVTGRRVLPQAQKTEAAAVVLLVREQLQAQAAQALS